MIRMGVTMALAAMLACAGLWATNAHAQTQDQAELSYGDETWAETREALFERLAGASNAGEAQRTAGLIWQFWMIGPDAETDALMAEAMSRRRVSDYDGAIAILDQVVERSPDYPEGWNQRATILFLQRKFDRSLDDVGRVLALEPKHFGALAGKGIILLQQGRAALAHDAIRQAAAIHPYLQERHLLPQEPGVDL